MSNQNNIKRFDNLHIADAIKKNHLDEQQKTVTLTNVPQNCTFLYRIGKPTQNLVTLN